jgi:hypothetical protein
MSELMATEQQQQEEVRGWLGGIIGGKNFKPKAQVPSL